MLVLDSTSPVVEQARHMKILQEAVERWAESVRPADLRPREDHLPAQAPGTQAQLANFVLLVDALNFCFWSDIPIRFQWRGRTYHRYEAMVVSLLLTIRSEPQWLQAEHWVNVPREEIEQVLAGTGSGELLMMDERERVLRETGQALIDRFDGHFIHAIESVNERAWPLVVLLMTNFDSFRDVASYGRRPVYLLKRAQICALDLSLVWQAAGHPPLEGLEELTAFADYRVPQALRSLGILEVRPELADAIERGDELVAGGEEEVEIRAATVQAVERMRLALAERGHAVPAWEIDCYLWRQAREGPQTPNHHRTRTVYY